MDLTEFIRHLQISESDPKRNYPMPYHLRERYQKIVNLFGIREAVKFFMDVRCSDREWSQIMNLEKFFYGPFRTCWVVEGPLAAYMRKTVHVIAPDKWYSFLDIANVTVDAASRRQGIFKSFLDRCEYMAQLHKTGMYIESIQSPELVNFLSSRGYSQTNTEERCPNAYKLWPDTRYMPIDPGKFLTVKQIKKLTKIHTNKGESGNLINVEFNSKEPTENKEMDLA